MPEKNKVCWYCKSPDLIICAPNPGEDFCHAVCRCCGEGLTVAPPPDYQLQPESREVRLYRLVEMVCRFWAREDVESVVALRLLVSKYIREQHEQKDTA